MGFGILSRLATGGLGALCEMIPSEKSLPSHSPLTSVWDEKSPKGAWQDSSFRRVKSVALVD